MSRRSVIVWAVACLAAAALGATAMSAAAHAVTTTLWTQAVPSTPHVAGDRSGVFAVWTVDEAAGAAVYARRYTPAGTPRDAAPVALLPATAGLNDLQVQGDGFWGLLLCWREDGTWYVQRFDVDGAAMYPAQAVCTAAALRSALGNGARGDVRLTPDGRGGAYLVVHAAAPYDADVSLLNRVTPDGSLVVAQPGRRVAQGVVGAASAMGDGSLAALLTPARDGTAKVLRFGADLEPAWSGARSMWNQVPSGAGGPTAIDVLAGGNILVCWHDALGAHAQRFTSAGTRLWNSPATTTASADALLSGDGAGGCRLAQAATGGVRTWHVSHTGRLLEGRSGRRVDLGLAAPAVGDIAGDASGDVSVSFADASDGTAGVVRFTYLGAWSRADLAPSSMSPAVLDHDGAGGLYAGTGGAGSGTLRRLGHAGLVLTLRPRAEVVTIGQTASFAGYLLDGGVPLGGEAVRLQWRDVDGSTRTAATALTGLPGLWSAAVAPQANGEWTAVASGLPGDRTARSATFAIGVRTRLSIALGHAGTRARPRVVAHGSVRPAHAGATVQLQRRAGGTWLTVARSRVNARSQYRFVWQPPARAGTYALRVVLPAHTDHLQGVSPIAFARVRRA